VKSSRRSITFAEGTVCFKSCHTPSASYVGALAGSLSDSTVPGVGTGMILTGTSVFDANVSKSPKTASLREAE
jgi:hypothetical protein